MAAVVVEALVDAPCPRVGLTVTGLGAGSASLVSVWRTADGERLPVRGARRVSLTDSAYLVDWDAPLGRPISYEVEVISGPSGASRVTSTSVTVASDTGWLSDPLIPQTAVQIDEPHVAAGRPTFTANAMSALEYASDTATFRIMGNDRPMVLSGRRSLATGIDLSMMTDALNENEKLRKLLMSSSTLLLRLPAHWQNALPGSVFVSVATVSEQPIEHGLEGALTVWGLSGDTVAAPTIRVLTASFSYGDVALLTTTYQQKQDAMAGKTYLDDLKNPLGG